jgi:hypothetical protein
MSDELHLNDEGDLVEPEIKRTPSGRFRKGVSGNPLGRAGKSGKASSNKINKSKLTAFVNKNGIAALEGIMRIGRKAEKAGEDNIALKAYVAVATEYTKLATSQERMQLELKKLNKALEAEQQDDDNSEELQGAILNFQSFNGTDN